MLILPVTVQEGEYWLLELQVVGGNQLVRGVELNLGRPMTNPVTAQSEI